MKLISIFASLCFLLLTTSCQGQSKLDDLQFLNGTWKIEGKSTFEQWDFKNDTFIGSSYKMQGDTKMVMETLQIAVVDESIVYEANVPSQNEGKTIPFELNTSISDTFSFENLNHDFPKKIQYKKITDAKILVHVLGEDDKGFSYYIIKQ